MYELPVLLPESYAITQSAVSTFLSCPKKYFFRYRLGLSPRRISKALAIGAAVHAGFEASCKLWKDSMQDVDTLTHAALQAVNKTFQDFFEDPDAITTDIEDVLHAEGVAAAAIQGWWQLIARAGWMFGEVVAVEQNIAPIPRDSSKWPYTSEVDDFINRMSGKIDLIIENETGLAIVEHKTRASFGVYDWTHFLAMDLQALWYLTLVGRHYEGVKETPTYFWYNGIVKDLHRTPKDYQGLLERRLALMEEEPSKFFFVKEVYVEPQMRGLFLTNMGLLYTQMNHANTSLDFVWNPKACDSYASNCPYRSLCVSGCDANNFEEVLPQVDWSSSLRVQTPNIELETE